MMARRQLLGAGAREGVHEVGLARGHQVEGVQHEHRGERKARHRDRDQADIDAAHEPARPLARRRVRRRGGVLLWDAGVFGGVIERYPNVRIAFVLMSLFSGIGILLYFAALLLLADTGARLLLAPAQLPVGIVTALIGVPVFLYLLSRER